jgi:hypothetical protein
MKGLAVFLTVLLLIGLIGSSNAFAKTYYVSPSGGDSAAGDINNPLRTPQKAASLAMAGDTIYLRGGTYRITAKTSTFVNFARSGTASLPIAMMSYPGENAIINGMLDRSDASYWSLYQGNIFYTEGLSGSGFDGTIPVVVQNDVVLKPQSSLSSMNGPGQVYYEILTKRLYVWATNGGNPGNYHLEVSQCDQIFLFDAADQHIVLENLTIMGAHYGIRSVPNGSHRTFRNLILKHFREDAIKFNTTGNHDDLVEYCKFSSYGDFGIDTYGSSYQIFRYNEFWGTHTWRNGGAIKSLADGKHHLIEGNYIHDIESSGWEGALELREAEYISVINNLIVNTAAGINIYGDNNTMSTPVPDPTSVGVEIVNNTIYHSKMPAIWLMKASRDSLIKNNIVFQESGNSYCLRVDSGGETGLGSDHNDFVRIGALPVRWLGTDFSLDNYKALTMQDAHSISQNPLFVNPSGNDFHLTEGSPALDQGDLNKAPALDMEKTSRPQGAGVDLGAYERVGSPLPPPPPDPPPPPPPTPGEMTTIELDISSVADDSYEKTYNCANSPTGSSLYVGNGYINGFRFVNVPIPQGAAITEAYLSFYCYGLCDKPFSIRYVGEAAGNALPFTNKKFDISSRSRTDAEIPDNPFSWKRNDYNPTEDLTPIIQEIIDQPDWRAGNAMAIFVHEDGSSPGYRVVVSYDSYPQAATKLIISYYTP